jgi:predicted GNAT superfamily acetyltransferase
MSAATLEIRRCQGIEELEACVRLQKEVWNFSDLDLIPLRLFVVADKIGGQVIGCFDGKEMVGFTLSIPGSRNGHPYLHSHMLAVRAQYRNLGLGRKLKLAQREDALAREFELIEWTFDPLEIKNAYLNIERLGAIARRYTCNQYGMSSSPLQGGLPTDRLVAEWWLRSQRVERSLSGKPNAVHAEHTADVPAEIYEWKTSADLREKARQVQSHNREIFLSSFRNGEAVLGYERNQRGDGRFLLGNWDESWSYATGAK